MNEWVLTQGMVGYKRILEQSGVLVDTNAQGIVVTKEALDQLPSAFFSFFLKKYSFAKREERVLRTWHARWKKGDKEYKKEMNKRLKEIEKNAGRYFKEHSKGQLLFENIDLYREQNDFTEQMDEQLEQIISSLKTKEIDEKLTSNIFKAVYLKSFYGQVSFLNVSKNALTIKEQIELLKKDFVQPVLDEWEFIDSLKNNNGEKCQKILQETTHKLLASLKRPLKKKNIDEIKRYLDKEVLRCSLTDFPLGLYNLEEGIFSPLALSMSNALNATWNSEGKRLFPISALARLLLFCAAAGSTVTNGKNVFVHYDGDFDAVYQSNEHYHTEADRDMSFDEIIFDIVKENKMRAGWLAQSYLILEYESDYDTKKTLLDYMIMTPNLVRLFQNHGHLFNNVHYTHKAGFIKLLIKNIDTKQFIIETLRKKIKRSYSSLEILFMTILRHYNQFYLREAEELMEADKQKNYIWVLYKSAESVRQKIGLKKAQGIAYRLLNAVQAGNKNTFMDTVMRVYISSELQMPTLLLETLHENQMDFETVANAWIAGLISKPNEEGVAINE